MPKRPCFFNLHTGSYASAVSSSITSSPSTMGGDDIRRWAISVPERSSSSGNTQHWPRNPGVYEIGASPEVVTARSARDALNIMKTARVNAMESDVAMPGEDGLWLVVQLRGLKSTQGG